MYTLGYRDEDLVGFTVELNNPSKIAELQELEHWKTKFDIASSQPMEGFPLSNGWRKLYLECQTMTLSETEEKCFTIENLKQPETAAEAEQAAALGGGGTPMDAGGLDAGGLLGEPGGLVQRALSGTWRTSATSSGCDHTSYTTSTSR